MITTFIFSIYAEQLFLYFGSADTFPTKVNWRYDTNLSQIPGKSRSRHVSWLLRFLKGQQSEAIFDKISVLL